MFISSPKALLYLKVHQLTLQQSIQQRCQSLKRSSIKGNPIHPKIPLEMIFRNCNCLNQYKNRCPQELQPHKTFNLRTIFQDSHTKMMISITKAEALNTQIHIRKVAEENVERAAIIDRRKNTACSLHSSSLLKVGMRRITCLMHMTLMRISTGKKLSRLFST